MSADTKLEEQVIGALLVSDPALDRVLEVGLQVDDFFLDTNRSAYAAVLRLHGKGDPVDQLTVKAELDRVGALGTAGGANRLDVLAATVVAPGNVKKHAERLRELSRERRLHVLLAEAQAKLSAGSLNGEVVQLADQLLDAQATDPDKVELLDLDGLRKLRPPSWLVRGQLVEDGLNLLYGAPGAGKSFLALDWSLSIATGQPWLDQPVKEGTVVYVAGEGAVGLRSRIEAWVEFHNTPNIDRFKTWPVPVNLWSGDTAALESKLKRLPDSPVLLVIDTVARCMPGGDENDTADMTLVVDTVDRLRRRYGMAALLVHHPRKGSDEPRGSSVLNGAVDTSRLLKVDGKVRMLTARKTKDWLDPPATGFALEPLGRSAVIRPRTVRDGSGRLEEEDEQILATVRKRFRTVWVSSADLLDASGMGRTAFYEALKRLTKAEKLEVRHTGRQRREYRLKAEEPTIQNRPEPSARTVANRPSGTAPLKGPDGGQSTDGTEDS